MAGRQRVSVWRETDKQGPASSSWGQESSRLDGLCLSPTPIRRVERWSIPLWCLTWDARAVATLGCFSCLQSGSEDTHSLITTAIPGELSRERGQTLSIKYTLTMSFGQFILVGFVCVCVCVCVCRRHWQKCTRHCPHDLRCHEIKNLSSYLDVS